MNKLDPFVTCPEYETESFTLRLVQNNDTEQLLKCYSDRNAVRFMNADNCNNDFFYPTLTQMQQAVDFWIMSYETRWFIRFSIIYRKTKEVIGTLEIFGGGCGVFRVDVVSEFEKEEYLKELYQLAKKEFFTLLGNERLVTKAIADATERRKALADCGWDYIGQFRVYDDYYESLIIK